MNKFYKAAIVAVSAAMVSQAAHAVAPINGLELGFDQSSANNDYIISLGLNTSIIDTTPVVDLSGDFSQNSFNSTFSSGPTGVSMGVVAGDAAAGQQDYYATAVRGGGAGLNPFVKGTETFAPVHNATLVGGGAAAILGNAGLPASGSTDSSGKPWVNTSASAIVGAASGTFQSKSGVNPDGTIGASDIIFEDLFEVTTAGVVYQGYFTFNDSNPLAPILTFTNGSLLAAPEPAAYGAFAGLGVLALALRRQFSRSNA